MTRNRRRCSRLRVQYRAGLRIVEGPEGARGSTGYLPCMTADVALNGVRIAMLTLKRLLPGSRVRLRIRPQFFARGHCLEGVLRWVRGDPSSPAVVLGIEFDGAKASARRWEDRVRRLAAQRGVELGVDNELAKEQPLAADKAALQDKGRK